MGRLIRDSPTQWKSKLATGMLRYFLIELPIATCKGGGRAIWQGGSLDLQSEVGVGTTVTVRLPAERVVSQTAGVSTGEQNRASAAE